MQKNPTKKGKVLLLLGLLFLILGNSLFREDKTPKYLMLGASIVILFLSVYYNLKAKQK